MVVLFFCVILLGYSRKIKYEKIDEDKNEMDLIDLVENGNNLQAVPIK